MSEFILPVDGPKIREAQKLLGLNPDQLAQLALRPNIRGERLDTGKKLGGFVLRLGHPNRGVVLRCFPGADYESTNGAIYPVPTDMTGLASHVMWHEEQLERLEEEGILIPTHYSIVVSRNSTVDTPSVITAVRDLYGVGAPLDAYYKRRTIKQQKHALGHQRKLLNYLKQDRTPDAMPAYDIYTARQALWLPGKNQTAIVDLDSLKSHGVIDGLNSLSHEASHLANSPEKNEFFDEINTAYESLQQAKAA